MARAKTLTFANSASGTSVKYELADATVGFSEFSTAFSYVVGDYCVYNNTLFRCISDVTAGSDFDASEWEATSFKEEFETLQSKVGGMIQESAFSIAVEDGEYVLYWYGAENECPYSLELENGEYVLYYTYDD